jgi:hypothetical protein
MQHAALIYASDSPWQVVFSFVVIDVPPSRNQTGNSISLYFGSGQ